MKKTSLLKRITLAALILLTVSAAVVSTLAITASAGVTVSNNAKETGTFEKTALLDHLIETTPYYVVIKAKQLGGSHYAYTEGLAEDLGSANEDPMTAEAVFNPNSSLVLLSLKDNGNGTVSSFEDELLRSTKGVLRDPCVSSDGKRLLFSWKQSSTDDFHLYEMDLDSRTYKQLTFGSGVADFEGQYLANGNIIFSSSRDIQTVDCWKTPVSNLYICDADGNNIRRVGYDQVHTTYPTTTSDGRVIYTRWDYNDRNQMYIQALFQMMPDGKNQTEVFGNNSNFPSTLLHTRDIPGTAGKYISIASGHHMPQYGKLVIVDTSDGRNSESAVQYVFPDSNSNKKHNVDNTEYASGSGRIYKYPYAISETEFLVATAPSYGNSATAFDICLMNTSGEKITLVDGTSSFPASQIVPVKSSSVFTRPDTSDYSSETATYYVANVYEGDGLKGIEAGEAKYLRVVRLVFRTSAIGATVANGTGTSDPYTPISTGNGSWDVKAVLGVVPIEEDGSALFRVPAGQSLYFQILDADGDVIQSMRSWSTLVPGETFSCVGCHENKNSAPVASAKVTQAMKKGVSDLQRDIWMADSESYSDYNPYSDAPVGFDYLTEIQTIFDESCVVCHSNTDYSAGKINADSMTGVDLDGLSYIIPFGSIWNYSIDGESEGNAHAPFGKSGGAQNDVNTRWSSGAISLTQDVSVTKYDVEACKVVARLKYSGDITLSVNGKQIYSASSSALKSEDIILDSADFTAGKNTVTVTCAGGTNYIDFALRAYTSGTETTKLFEKGGEWKYLMTTGSTGVGESWTSADFDDSDWLTGEAPFGDRNNDRTSWNSTKLLWLRREFTVEDVSKLSGGELFMNAWYDDNVKIYINGKLVFSDAGWVDNYSKLNLNTGDLTELLKNGVNIIAVSLNSSSSYGGSEFDAELSSRAVDKSEAKETTAEFSLESYLIGSSRMQKSFPLSYLYLTNSRAVSGIQWKSDTSLRNKYLSWISCMSRCEMLEPYEFGAHNSGLITKLRTGHGNLTDSQIRRIACWIDLAVPCYGDYSKNNDWNGNSLREYQEKNNKRAFYDMLDKLAKNALAGNTVSDSIEVTYTPKSGNAITKSGNGYVIIYTGTKYRDGDAISVKLPGGGKYIAVSLSSKMGESIIYVPDGKWEYVFKSLATSYPATMNPAKNISYTDNTITVRIPEMSELTATHNLAYNAYDLTDAQNAYPHVTCDNYYNNQQEFAARNVIDGFSVNKGHGNYPYQSWGPANSDHHWIKIDFGREVTVDELMITIRADFPHDTYYTRAVAEFSDGTTQTLNMHKTEDAMVFDLCGKKVTSVKLMNFVRAESTWAAISEIAVIGSESPAL